MRKKSADEFHSYPQPSLAAYSVTYSILAARRFILRYLTLPRIISFDEFNKKDPKTGKYSHNLYIVHPYYVKPTFINRWGPTALMTRLLGGIVPGGKDGAKYHPDGYTMDEVGPNRKRGKGQEELQEIKQHVERVRPMGCPFAITR